MADDAFFRRFRANTLKNLIKWIHNPNDPRCTKILEKNIPADKSRNNAANKRLTAAVKTQLTSINQLSSIKKQFMRQIVDTPSNLKNGQFINNLLNTLRPNRHQLLNTNNTNNNNMNNINMKTPKNSNNNNKNTMNTLKSSKKQRKTMNNNNNSNDSIMSNFRVESANKLIISYKQNEFKLSELCQKIAAYQGKLDILKDLASDGNMVINASMTDPINDKLKTCLLEENSYKFRRDILIKIIHKIRKQESKILQSKKTKTLQQIMEKLILSRNEAKTKNSFKLNTLEQREHQIKQQLVVLCTNVDVSDFSVLQQLKTEQITVQKQTQNIKKTIQEIEIFVNGIQCLLNEVIYDQPIDINQWHKLYTYSKTNTSSNISLNIGNTGNINHSPISMSSVNTNNNPINYTFDSCNNSVGSLPSIPASIKPQQSIISNISNISNDTLYGQQQQQQQQQQSNNININTASIATATASISSNNNNNNMRVSLPVMTDQNNQNSFGYGGNNKIYNKSETISTPKKKQKFKRPTRSKAVKAKRITICDILPHEIYPIKLSNKFLSNGSIRDISESMFETEISSERMNWINQYNSRTLPATLKRFKSLYGNDIYLKPIPNDPKILKPNQAINSQRIQTINTRQNISNQPIQPLTSPPPHNVEGINNNKKRTFDDMHDMNINDGNMQLHKKQKIEDETDRDNNNNNNNNDNINNEMEENEDIDDCINDLSEDEEEEEINDNLASIASNTESITAINAPTDCNDDNNKNKKNETGNDVFKYKRNSKQILNLNAGKNNPFKPDHQKRYKVKTNINNKTKLNKKEIAKNHPLFQNDPLILAQQEEENKMDIFGDGNCLHWMARGICGYLKDRKCRFNHPPQFAAKNFYCPTLRKTNHCNRGNHCIFTHNLQDIPCKDHYSSKCDKINCFYSHQFTKNQFMEWIATETKRNEAWQQWQANRMKKNNQNNIMMNNNNNNRNAQFNVDMNQNKDERLTSTTTDQLFNSALTE